jgi:hypothetical protein
VKKLLSIVVLAAVVAGTSSAQAGLSKVLRAVFFPSAETSAVLDKEGQALVRGAPEMLATSIASLQPFNRAPTAPAARSIVTVTASPGTEGKVSLRIQLVEAGAVKSESVRELSAQPIDLVSFKTAVGDAASQFAPLLGPVDPEADVLKVSSEQQLVRAAQETDYLDQLNKRFEFTFWTSGLMRLLDSTGVGGGGQNSVNFLFSLDILPVIVEADWFFSKDLGALFSFYFNDSNAFDFGSGSRYHAYGAFFFPGIGIIYRTLGEVSAEFAVTISAGFIHLTANSGTIVDRNNNIVLAQGSSMWSSLAGRIRLSPGLVWSITPSVALKGSLGFDIIFPGMFPWYSDSPIGSLQFLSIGAAYRM